MSNSAVMPSASSATPVRATPLPTQIRLWRPVGVSLAWSRRAATGGMPRTRRDGPSDDSTVAPTPTTAATMIVRGLIGMVPGRFPKSMVTSTHRRNAARR